MTPRGRSPSLLWAAVLLLAGCYIANTDGLAVMSIDFGSEFMKIAIVKPGVPMEIALNKESRRKTPVVISMRDGDRSFGDPAVTTGVKFPKLAYWYFLELVGKKLDHPEVQAFQKRFPYYQLTEDSERGTVVFQHDEKNSYSPQELAAMILDKAKEIAADFAEQPIKDAVITVPPYFNQAERRALLQAAELAGLNVLQLMNDNAAVALNYGVFRRKSFNGTAQYYMFYDMGATSTVASVVEYKLVKTKDKGFEETIPQLAIKGVGFDRTLGGLEVQLRLRDHLAKLFNEQKKTKNDVFKNPRSMGKLFKEAGRVKQVLSANSEHFAQVEGLLDDLDFRAKVKRDELETMCEDLFARVGKPAEEALKMSHITMSEISEVILFGGGTRVPKVQEMLKKAIGLESLGKGINSDEAAALGGVYQAAHLSKGFRVKRFGVKDANLYPIQVEFDRTKTGDDGKETVKTVKRTLFGRNNPYPQKKVMTFNKHTKDFTFAVNYGDISFLGEGGAKSFGSNDLLKVSLMGVDAAHEKNKDAEAKGVKAHFRMDESGVLYMDKVESVFEKAPPSGGEEESTLSKLGSTISSFFSGKKEEKDEAKAEEAKEEEKAEGKTEGKGDAADDKKGEKPKEEQKTNEKKEKAEEKKKEEPSEEKKETKEEDKEKKDDKKTENTTANATDDKAGNKTEEAKPLKPVTVKEDVEAKTEILDLAEPSTDSVKASQKKIDDLRALDKEKHLLEKAKNELESFIYEAKDKLSQEDYEKCSKEEERTTLKEMMNAADDWMYEQDDDTPRQTFQDKYKQLKGATKDLWMRVKEFGERPKAFQALKDMLNHTSYFYKGAANLTGEDQPFTQVEVDTLGKLINDTKKWKKSMEKDQREAPLSEKPKVTVEDIATKIQALDREVNYLLNKAKMFRPKPKKEEKNSTKSSNTTEKTDSETDKTSTNDTKDKSEETTSDSKKEKEEVKIEVPVTSEEEVKPKEEAKEKKVTEEEAPKEPAAGETASSKQAGKEETKETPKDSKQGKHGHGHEPDDEL